MPVDWDIIDSELASYLNKYTPKIQEYIKTNLDNWINDLPPVAKQVELERAKGIENESWWDNYRGDSKLKKADFSGKTSEDFLSKSTIEGFIKKKTIKDFLK